MTSTSQQSLDKKTTGTPMRPMSRLGKVQYGGLLHKLTSSNHSSGIGTNNEFLVPVGGDFTVMDDATRSMESHISAVDMSQDPTVGELQLPVVDDSVIPEEDCTFCCRPAGQIVCRGCCHVFKGRARFSCPTHPNVIHLMDIPNCTRCGSYKLKEF